MNNLCILTKATEVSHIVKVVILLLVVLFLKPSQVRAELKGMIPDISARNGSINIYGEGYETDAQDRDCDIQVLARRGSETAPFEELYGPDGILRTSSISWFSAPYRIFSGNVAADPGDWYVKVYIISPVDPSVKMDLTYSYGTVGKKVTVNAMDKFSFNSNCTDNVNGIPGNVSRRTGFPLKFPDAIPSRQGYGFVNWTVSSFDMGFCAYEPGSTTSEVFIGNVFYARWASTPKITTSTFEQSTNKVRLEWQANVLPCGGKGRWGIYRNNTLLDTVPESQTWYEDVNTGSSKDFPYESTVNYRVCYVYGNWADNTQRAGLFADVSVSTQRQVYVTNLSKCVGDTSIILTWNTDAFPKSLGHSFRVYIDNDPQPVTTVYPESDNQNVFQWEHRASAQLSERVNGHNGWIYWTEEPLYACEPHTYTVKSVIGNTEPCRMTLENVAISANGTSFRWMRASKGTESGSVRLDWEVVLHGSVAPSYTIDRRRAETEDAWTLVGTITTTNQQKLSFMDNEPDPGICYDYRVTVTDVCANNKTFNSTAHDIGYAQVSGSISGSVTYGSSGTAVPGVTVKVRKSDAQSGTEDKGLFRALHFLNTSAQLVWKYPSASYAAQTFNNKPFSIQFWFDPDILEESTILNFGEWSLGMKADLSLYIKAEGTDYTFNSVRLDYRDYNHITLTRIGDTLTVYKVVKDSMNLPILLSEHHTITNLTTTVDSLRVGGFVGFLDEFRLWKRCLTPQQILDDHDRLLAGNEQDLETYWTFDDGLNRQSFDHSYTSSGLNNHHCQHQTGVWSDANKIPTGFALKAITNSAGNYTIHGVPFAGDKMSYMVVPMLGVHQFSPENKEFSMDKHNLVVNDQNFTDVSSFVVRGRVLYAGTDYPVEGCRLQVDGIHCSKDNNVIETNANGEYEISVPIGDHFIQVVKEGHVFTNQGRYPKDENGFGLRHTFNNPMDNLTFYDETLVNLTGRIAGGDIQTGKAVGFGLSKNNLGMATLVLKPQNSDKYRLNVLEEQNGTIVDYRPNEDIVCLSGARPDTIRSKAWRGGGLENSKRIFIRTDSLTGEFSALVPPLVYTVDSIYVASSGLNVITTPLTVDMTNANISHKDTLNQADGTQEFYSYHTKIVPKWHSQPQFTVLQKGNPDGSFGIDSTEVKDDMGVLKIKDIHHVNAQGKVEYTYGAPLFVMKDPYEFLMEGYELYENKDAAQVVWDIVPLANTVVTIQNALSSDQAVCTEHHTDSIPGSVYQLKSNQLRLDSTGKASYLWHAGIPNITSPYTRTINIYYDLNGNRYNWSGNSMNGIILGDMSTGNNFVTAGPNLVQMVLRDPPGSKSSTSWVEGSSKTSTQVQAHGTSTTNTIKFTEKVGVKSTTGIGLGVMVITATEAKGDVTGGTKLVNEWTNSSTYTTTISTSKVISTSDNNKYVGADADVFIGIATNLVFGKVRHVALYRNPKDTAHAYVGLQDAISPGMEFTTSFSYTQHYIEHDLIPNLRLVRNAFLQHAVNPDTVTNHGNAPLYVTSLLPDNPKYGTENTYRMVVPSPIDTSRHYTDTVHYFNQQIAGWQDQLKMNEKEKVSVYNHRAELEAAQKVTNYSFDAGTSISITTGIDSVISYRRDTTFKYGVIVGGATGFTFNCLGFETSFNDESMGSNSSSSQGSTKTSSSFKYTLKDDDTNDAISVDVYSDQGKYGSPIFRTRGGQTSNPYEGETKTKYYGPGLTIMEATMQIEKPEITVTNPTATDVTSGTAANFELHLKNQSEVNANCTFKLYVVDKTNPHGAQLIVDGNPLTEEGRQIKVPYGEELIKSMQLMQSDMSILNYEDIEIILASSKQSSISSTTHVSAHFVPSASPVTMELNMTTMNTQTGTDLIVTMKDFDRNYYHQKAFRLQYRQQGGDWTTFHEYVLNTEDMTGISELLPAEGASINYTLPMKDYSAGIYRFRIVSVSTFGTDEIYVYSNEMEVVKNLNRPRPLGLAEPADGILDIGDELSITFNEEFVSGELTKTKNFLITGVLNGAPLEHQTALQLYKNRLAAQTEASVNLSNKDFTVDMWVNIHSDGLLFSHGTAKDLQIGTDSAGHLMIQIEDSVNSNTILPHDKWLFLTLSYRRDTAHGFVSAAIAYDDVTEQLFLDMPVPLYMDRGPIFIGGGAASIIHELLLWDEAHDIATSLSQRSVIKNPSTPHLIGYWKMNEGEGKTIRDYSRNRHMNTTDANWFLNNVNKALTLDVTHHFAAFTGNVPPMPTDDYAAELWFKAGKQNGEAQLFQLGEVGLYLDTLGKLHLQSGANDQIINHKFEILNNSWHHVLFNVHRFGTAAVYVDGERALTVSADKIGDLASDSLRIGLRRTYVPATATMQPYYRYDRPFQGTIDEVRLWQATLQSDMLASNRKQRLRGDEPGLSLYYPFEKKSLDEYNQVIVSGTMEEFTGHGEEAVISGQPSAISYSDEAPALKEKPTETNVSFSFTASNTKIVIDIDEEPARIEGCMLNITVRDVRSNTGNYSLPATWTAFVHRNELAWTDDELSTITNNQSPITNHQLSTALINRSGTPQRWTLSGLPAWLTVNATSGMLNPLQQQSLAFHVSASAPIGKHELTVYAMGNNGIETPLTLHITITGNLPDWTVNPADYENSMSVIAQLDFFGEISEDEDDIVAAFIGDECRGIAQPEYKERYDAYYLTMTIYGDSTTDNKTVSFRAYKASTGVIYTQVTPSDSIRSKALSFVGSYKEPVMLSAKDRIEQRLALKQGWNWISLSVKADDMRPQAILQDIENDVIAIKGHHETQGIDVGFMTHTDTGWVGYMEPLLNRRSYMIKAKRDCELRIIGTSVEPATHTVRIHANWGWPGYFGQHRIALADAFADADPQPGDIVRTKQAAAYYDDYEWVGPLWALEPGQGYAYYSVTNEEKWFAYPSSSVAAAPRRNEIMRKYENEAHEVIVPLVGKDIVNDFAYPYNMILVGQVLLDNEPAANARIAVFDGDECRSIGYTDDDGNLLMLVAGEDEATLSYKLILNDQVFETVQTLHYVTDAIVGTPDSPHLIRFGEGQGIGNVQGDDVQCTKVLRDGILFIQRNGVEYNANGMRVK